MERLDPLRIPLNGFNLIEASAGTGKTYTITALYVRIVVEAAIPVNRVLVVTYTNAATKELRDRIRARLIQIRQAFLQGRATDGDDLAVHLFDRTDREVAIRRLTNAVRGFDEAAIFTIHGFCQRALGDAAFESGLAFDTELLADTSDLLQEIVDDFWRREFYAASPVVVQYFLQKHYSPESLRSQIERYLGKPYLEVIAPKSDGAALERTFLAAFEHARDCWVSDFSQIEQILLQSPALHRNKYRPKSVAGWLQTMNSYLLAETPQIALFDQFDYFTPAVLEKSIKTGQVAPRHPFFAACATLKTACEALAEYCRYQIPAKLLDWCNAELASRKRQQQFQSYDDLLLNLHAALHHPRQSSHLTKMLSRRYAAALIDEFQDTDPVQYAIFQRIYAGSQQPVFLVGDPKQAIYSFRGADIFAYLTARRDTPRQYTLDVNWRSDPRLLTALNTVFGTVKEQPFLFDGIPFHHAIPAPQKVHERLSIQGQLEPPFQVWLLEPEGDHLISKGKATELAAQATAAEIARLLNLGARQQATIGTRPLTGGDIAVLVRSHRQGRLIRDHLLRLNVPSVQHADDSVFESDEALQLEWFLGAVAEPGHEGRVRTVLASDLFGLSGEELYRLREDEHLWARWLEKLQDYRHLWREQGFIRFCRTWLMADQVPQRLLAFRDGERRLTNLLHLIELLHVASRSHPGLIGLCKWLAERRRVPSKQDEAQQLRLESDEHLVRIVTVHKSKGLEYPIVFCPFLWHGRLQVGEKDDTLLYHDPHHPERTTLAIGLPEEDPARHQARREAMAENLRLFYVALTRAQQRCYLVWGPYQVRGQRDEAGTAPPAWLLHRPTVKEVGKDWLQTTQERFKQLQPGVVQRELQTVIATAGGTMALTPLSQKAGQRYQPPTAALPQPKARPFSGVVPDTWRIGSFTALTAGQTVEMPDHDLLTAAPVPLVEESIVAATGYTIFTLPRGARVGTCLHTLFEHLDFTQQDRSRLDEQVSLTLTGHGLDAAIWTPVVTAMVERVLATPLNAEGLQLATVTPERRLIELEFHYPLANLRADTLRQVLVQHGYTDAPFREMIEALEFNPVRGYMKGFIDLVFEADGRFYLVDYKSNWLGAEPADYQHTRLKEAMAREAYVLQYLIYSVALHRYLRLRLPTYTYAQHFGGVFYLFLRGMDPVLGSDYGIFRDRPAQTLVEALDTLMATGRPT